MQVKYVRGSTEPTRAEVTGEVSEGVVTIGCSPYHLSHIVSLTLYSSADLGPSTVVPKNLVTSGQATFSATECGHEYSIATNGILTFPTEDSSYPRPNALGSFQSFKVDLSAIVGATHYKIILASVGGVT